jgi:uncharacterized membrane protein YfcA
MMSHVEMVALACSAAAAGAINAVAGGGTLLTFPTLLAFGTAPVTANATSTLALLIGTGASVYGYRKYTHPVRPWLRRFLPASLVGGLIGSALLTGTNNKIFAKLVPFLILFATLLFLAQGAFRRFALSRTEDASCARKGYLWKAVLFQFAVAIYGGYFGAGIGILMLATLGFIGMQDIFEMNTLKTILGSLINLMAAIWFMGAGLIDWPRAGIMTIGALFGYYVGSHYSQRIPQARVRQIITAIGFIIAGATFYTEFIR